MLALVPYVLYTAYKYVLPRPIPGIPYDPKSAKSLFGDALGIVAHFRKTGQLASWMTNHAIKLNSPISQVFAKPLNKPWVRL
jgi:hypothetical protein